MLENASPGMPALQCTHVVKPSIQVKITKYKEHFTIMTLNPDRMSITLLLYQLSLLLYKQFNAVCKSQMPVGSAISSSDTYYVTASRIYGFIIADICVCVYLIIPIILIDL